MLERMQLKDFQRHELLDIKFDPGITTLVGPSDVGKSAVLRALRWALLNRPRGDGFIRHGAKGTTVRAKLDGKTIVRQRGSRNIYKLGDQEFEAFGNDVPPPIANHVNLGDVCMSGQHDSPFWFDLTPGEVAKQLNKIVDLEAIDNASAELASRVRVQNVKLGVVEERLAEAKKEQASLIYVGAVDKELGSIELMESEVRTASNKVRDLFGILEEARRQCSRVGVLKKMVEQLQKVLELGKAAVSLRKQAAVLAALAGQVESTEEEMLVAPPSSAIEALKKLLDSATSIKRQYGDLKSIVASVADGELHLNEVSLGLKAVKAQLNRELDGRCPLCGGVWDNKK